MNDYTWLNEWLMIILNCFDSLKCMKNIQCVYICIMHYNGPIEANYLRIYHKYGLKAHKIRPIYTFINAIYFVAVQNNLQHFCWRSLNLHIYIYVRLQHNIFATCVRCIFAWILCVQLQQQQQQQKHFHGALAIH